MKIKQLSLAALIIFLIVAPSSCKKEDEDLLNMTGDLTFDLPKYSFGGETYHLSFEGVTDPVDPEYYWIRSWESSDTLFSASVTITLPYDLENYTVVAYADHDDYNRKSNYQYVTVIDTTYGATLSGISRGEGRLVDLRDNQEYTYITVGNLQWMTKDMNWKERGVPAQESEVLALLYGRHYSWSEATGGESGSGLAGGPQGVCPEGWSIPTNEDWENLAQTLNGGEGISFIDKWSGLGEKITTEATFNGDRLWTYSPNNSHRDQIGWNSYPTGAYLDSEKSDKFLGFGEYAFYWSAGERDEETAYYRYIYFDADYLHYNSVEKDGFRASVRCVRLK